MHKFFVKRGQIFDGVISITGEDHLHISKSLRMKSGDKLQLSDGTGLEYIGEILQVNKDSVEVAILKEFENDTESPVEICLFQGYPKASKMDWIVQKSVELGVRRIVPVLTDRSVASADSKTHKKTQRWERICYEAAKQSKRGIVPEIKPVVALKDVGREVSNCNLLLVAYEEERQRNLKQVLMENKGVKEIGVFIGPEGGFTKGEIDFLKSLGGLAFSLGKRILRTETAGLAVISMLIYQFEMGEGVCNK